MTTGATVRRRALRQRASRVRATLDTGVTLVELVTSMAIMAVVAGTFTTAVVQMFRTASTTEAAAAAQSQANVIFLRLERELRYASGVAPTDPVRPYVDYVTANNGTVTCTRLRLVNSGTIQELRSMSWIQGVGATSDRTWTRLLSNVTARVPLTSLTAPFIMLPATTPVVLPSAAPTGAPTGAVTVLQRLRLQLVIGSGTGGNSTSRMMDITFTAMNTAPTATSTAACTSEGL
ncbi:MAG TPA: hypothetical protein VK453_17635 [Micromonosporaceae bacterium]|nr:hypothetical protein [Micromonosporaceae bacterium]